MAVQGLSEAPSRRFIRGYLAIWAVLAVGALGYLGTLAWQPDQMAPGRPKVVEPDLGLKAATKALAEVDTVRESVEGLQKGMSELKDTVERGVDQDKILQSRLTALEEKVAAIPTGVAAANSTTTTTVTLPGKQKAAEKAPAKAAPAKTAQATKPVAPRVVTVPNESSGSAPANSVKAQIETGSLGFGEPVVTKAGESFAVQLDVAPSVDVLRLRWSLLLERYGSTLGNLQPRFIAPRTQGAPYRLVAGPVASIGDARDICTEVRAQLPACVTTDFVGEPL